MGFVSISEQDWEVNEKVMMTLKLGHMKYAFEALLFYQRAVGNKENTCFLHA